MKERTEKEEKRYRNLQGREDTGIDSEEWRKEQKYRRKETGIYSD
jgi:hypothetical protein